MTGVARLLALVVACAAVTAPDTAWAATAALYPDALTGRLREVKESGVVRLGYRENAIPFSYTGPDAQPVGYSIDLCHAIVATIAEDLGGPPLKVEYVRVTPEDRIERVVSGAIDLECGSSTATAERRRLVAFSPVVFVTGTRLAVRRGSEIRNVGNLPGRSVAVVRGTTNEAAMREVDRLRRLAIRFVVAADYREALALLGAGKADALAADEVLLRGYLVETGRARDLRIVGEMLSFEPYGIMFPRGDPLLADAVERTLRALAATREIVWIYDRWFVRPLPSGGRLGMPMNAELRRSFELMGLPPD
jgi:glutamate/aspartate transport system substrate-binding protein